MRVLSSPLGRLGNAIFRYLATIVYHIVFNATIIHHSQIAETDEYLMITDEQFIYWMNAHLNGDNLGLDEDKTYGFLGYFQHDAIYLKYRSQIIDYIRKHPTDILTTDGNNGDRDDFTYFHMNYSSGHLVNTPQGFNKYYDTVGVAGNSQYSGYTANPGYTGGTGSQGNGLVSIKCMCFLFCKASIK